MLVTLRTLAQRCEMRATMYAKRFTRSTLS